MLAVTPELFLLLVLFSLGSRDCIRISYWLFPIRSCNNLCCCWSLAEACGWSICWSVHGGCPCVCWEGSPTYTLGDERSESCFKVHLYVCFFFLSSQMMTSLCICLSLTPSSHLFIISEECQHSTNTPAASCLQTDGQTDAIGGLLM